MYKNLTIPELEKEVARIHEMIINKVKQTPTKKFKQFEADRALELKRMKEELVAAVTPRIFHISMFIENTRLFLYFYNYSWNKIEKWIKARN